MIPCATQEQMDYYYSKLSAVSEAEMCGWICDRFGLSWQIIPDRFTELMKSQDKVKTANMMKKLLSMKRLNIAELEAAYDA